MDEAFAVRRRQALARLQVLVEDLPPGPVLARQPGREVGTIEELHRDPHPAFERADLVDLHDVGVREPPERSSFAKQPRLLVLVAIVVQQLERDLAIELLVLGLVHDPHPARSEDLAEPESADANGFGLDAEQLAAQRALDPTGVDIHVVGGRPRPQDHVGHFVAVVVAALGLAHLLRRVIPTRA